MAQENNPRLDIKSAGGEISIFHSDIGRVGIYVNDDYEGACAVFYADKSEARRIIDMLEQLIDDKISIRK